MPLLNETCFMNVITVGNANAQEAILAINVRLSFDSAEEHRSLLGFC